MLFLSSSSWRQPEKAWNNVDVHGHRSQGHFLPRSHRSATLAVSLLCLLRPPLAGSGCYPAAHINVLEVRGAGSQALPATPDGKPCPLVAKYHIDCVKSLHQGGKLLLEVTKELLTWAAPCMINLGAMYLPGQRNHFAEFLSSCVIRVMRSCFAPKKLDPTTYVNGPPQVIS